MGLVISKILRRILRVAIGLTRDDTSGNLRS